MSAPSAAVSTERIDRELLEHDSREAVPTSAHMPGACISPRSKPLTQNDGRQFLYARYNVELTGANLRRLGFEQVDPLT